MPSNTAAWLPARGARLEVAAAPYPTPRENEIVVLNRAIAVNPIDWVIPIAGDFAFPWIAYPFVLGSDLAGEVVAVGAGVSRFAVGDRVLAHAVGTDKSRNSAAEGSFQRYTVVLATMAAPIPDAMPYERAAVLPLALSTAACGLFQKDQLALSPPTVPPRPNGKTLLVWGGSTSVGSNAIQLAVAAGCDVVATASRKNFDYVKKLGASRVFDYNDSSVVRDVVSALRGKTIAGAFAIGAGSARACIDVVGACTGNRFVSMATYPVSFGDPSDGREPKFRRLTTIRHFLWFSLTTAVLCRIRGIRTKFIFGTSLITNEVDKIVYVDFLPQALAAGTYVAAPDPSVVGNGLASIQTALDVQRKGVSATKVVVTLNESR